MTFSLGVYSYAQQLWYMTEKTRWWGWAQRNLLRITQWRVMSPLPESEWSREINAPSFSPFLLACSLRYLFTFHSVSTHPPRFPRQTWQIQSEGGYRWIWLPSLSSPMPGCEEIRAVCYAVWDGKGQLVNQPVFLPLEFISIQSRETWVCFPRRIDCSLFWHDHV